MGSELRFNLQGLIPTIVQDSRTKEVLMVAYMNQESLQRTRETGQAWFWSRSRQELWHKGATSGNYLHVERIIADCDRDTLLLQVEPVGPVCHTGAVSCFHNTIQGQQISSPGFLIAGQGTDSHNAQVVPVGEEDNVLEEVYSVIESRRKQMPPGSYVTKLFLEGLDRIAQKVGEEGVEVVIAAKNEDKQALISEVADLWFHSLILLSARGLRPADIWKKLEERAQHRRPGN